MPPPLLTPFLLPFLPSDLAADARRMYLIFNLTRAAELEFHKDIAVDWQASNLTDPHLPPNVLALDLDAADMGEPVLVSSKLERPELIKFVVEIVRNGIRSFFALASLSSACPDTAFLWIQQTTEEALDFGPIEYLNSLEAAIGPPPRTRLDQYRWFFFDLDRRTDMKLAEVYLPAVDPDAWVQLKRHLDPAMRALGQRIAHRYDEYGLDPFRYSVPTYSEAARYAIEHFSQELLGVFFRHFSTTSGLLDLDSIEEAFEMFSNGELRLQLPELAWTTQPSSGFYVYFAEFSQLATELNMEARHWSRLVNVFVRTQRIYCDVYVPKSADPQPKLTSYWACGYEAKREFPCSRKAKLRREFRDLSFLDLCLAAAHHTREFFPGGVT